MDINGVLARLAHITESNHWEKYHAPKNLAMAASVEMSELLEIFQWKDGGESLNNEEIEHAGQEMADVFMYLLMLSKQLNIDFPQALENKLKDNERRFLS